MNKRVGMFVWNHFTNDARVLREGTALSESGYTVDLLCIEDSKNPDLPRFEKVNSQFNVVRVRENSLLLILFKRVFSHFFKHKASIAAGTLLWLVLGCFFPKAVILLSIVLILSRTKLRIAWQRAGIMAGMAFRGWIGGYDIYHSNDLNTLIQGYIGAKWRWKKRQLVYDSHEVQTSRTGYNSRLYGILESFLVKKVDEMIVENHTRAKHNEELYGFYPNVVHNYPFKQNSQSDEKVSLHKILNIDPSEKILLYQGGIQTGRGLEKLIKAVPHFSEGVLVLIGEGKIKPQLLKMVQELKLENKVKFLPKVPLEELPKYTRNAYIGFQVLNNVCFNHYSASSNKLFEYLMAGVPVVACSFPEIQKVVENEKAGICVDSHDPYDIAVGVNFLLANPDIYERMKANCIGASDRYNWDQEKHRLLSTYSALFTHFNSGQLKESF